MIQQYLYYFGVWEPNLTAWLDQRLVAGDIFVDVGANIGYFSMLASRRVGGAGAIVAIEASPAIFHKLAMNVSLNRARNVRLVNEAAAEDEGTVPIYQADRYNSGRSSTIRSNGLGFEAEVRARPLHAILTKEEISRARVVKVDVEGAEASVVLGLAPVLPTMREDLEVVVEIDPETLRRQGESPDTVVDLFRANGFHAYRIENDYEAASYINRGVPSRPVRLNERIEYQSDVIFSRIEADGL